MKRQGLDEWVVGVEGRSRRLGQATEGGCTFAPTFRALVAGRPEVCVEL